MPVMGRHQFATTWGTTTYLPPHRWALYMGSRPLPTGLQDQIRHEDTHIRQWVAEGVWYALKYLFSRKWRLRYEVKAYAEQARSNPTNERTWRYAGYLSSWRYGWLGDRKMIVYMIRGNLP